MAAKLKKSAYFVFIDTCSTLFDIPWDGQFRDKFLRSNFTGR
ncbi:hypothetical protein T05_6434 [Trichinella murrelli]|uniref:Uncharacterized protein n=1 Tax=Trichinella murrelli TaxID=144512 RepID=A0A0V0T0J9_9BILA|nr:hypothetical protein T05_6434 [Trichinella murrelli]